MQFLFSFLPGRNGLPYNSTSSGPKKMHRMIWQTFSGHFPDTSITSLQQRLKKFCSTSILLCHLWTAKHAWWWQLYLFSCLYVSFFLFCNWSSPFSQPLRSSQPSFHVRPWTRIFHLSPDGHCTWSPVSPQLQTASPYRSPQTLSLLTLCMVLAEE